MTERRLAQRGLDSELPVDDPASRSDDSPKLNDQAVIDRSWVRLAAGILFVLVVAGSFTYLLRDELMITEAPDQLLENRVVDRFERANDLERMGAPEGNDAWDPVRGTWGIDVGKAILTTPGDDLSVTLLERRGVTEDRPSGGGDGVAADVGGSGSCGVVAMYSSPDEYIALVRAPESDAWDLVRRSDGESQRLTSLPFDGNATVGVRLDVGQRTALISVGGTKASVGFVPGDSPSAGLLGLVAVGDDAVDCTWDDVEIGPRS